MQKSIKFRLRIEHLWALIALVGIFAFVNTHPIRPHDFWWHITVGREILFSHQIPTIDVYSFTANGQPYPSFQMYWLMEIFLYWLYKTGGPALVVFIHSLMITSAYSIIFWICMRVSKNWRLAALSVLFAATLGINDWNVRPQDITFLLAALFLWASFEYQRSKNWRWLIFLPVGMVIWANSHGTFVIGLVIIGLWFGQEGWDLLISRLRGDKTLSVDALLISLCVLVITALACLVNPRGLGILDYLRTLTGNPAVQKLVVEWAAPSFHDLLGIIFFAGMAMTALVLIISPHRPRVSQVLAYLVFGALSLKTSRGIVWFGIVMAPILAEHLAYIYQKYRKPMGVSLHPEGSRLLNVTFFVLIASAAVISLPWFKEVLPMSPAKAGLISVETPIQATQVLLAQNPPGELFNAMSFGSYLIWSAYPNYRVFVDSRIELFSQQTWVDYLNISNAVPGWEALLRSYGVNTLMLSQAEQPRLVEAARSSGEWVESYQDSTAYIFIRR